jgi:hypothetical protein
MGMYATKPKHAFFRVTVVFMGCVLVALALAYGAWRLVGSRPVALGVFIVVTAGLVYALLPTFRRLLPDVAERNRGGESG